MCEPEEGWFSVRNPTFAEGDVGKTALFRSFFPDVLEIAQPNFTEKETATDGTLRTLSRLWQGVHQCALDRGTRFSLLFPCF